MKLTHIKNPYLLYTSLFILLIGSILLVSFSGWNGKFIFDDYPNILNNSSLNIDKFSIDKLLTASLSGEASSLGRPFSMLSFALNSLLHGLDPFFYKLSNTIIHIINAVLVFFLSLKLLRLSIFKQSLLLTNQFSVYLAFFISLIWAITPANINSSLYIVQRMNELSFLFTFSGCILYLQVRTNRALTRLKQSLLLLLLILFLALGILSKENGVLLIPLLGVFELFLLKKQKNTYNKFFLYYSIILLFLIPVIILCYYIFTHYNSLLNYSYRDFTLTERVLTQFRVLIYYIQQLIFPNIYLFNYDFDHISKSESLLQPISTLYSLILLILSITLGLLYHKKFPWLLFGVLWFFIGHSIESSILPLVLTYEHRNYLPSYGIIFILVSFAYYLYTHRKIYRIKFLFPTLFGSYIVFLFIYSFLSASIVGNTNTMLKINAESYPNSARSQHVWGRVLFYWFIEQPENLKLKKITEQQLNKAFKLNPSRIATITTLILLKQIDHKNNSQEIKQLYQILPQLKNDAQHLQDTRTFIQSNKQLKNPLSAEIIYTYFDLILANKQIIGKYKGYLHREYADFIFLQKGLTEQVYEQLEQSVRLAPSISNKLNLAQVLIYGNKLEQAKLLIAHIEQTNTKHLFIQNIENLKALLTKVSQFKRNQNNGYVVP